ncbi:hypothetical protein ACFWNK_14825 [Streptomyces sp. NPDC058417]|uniref:hypothetical protein n=1 Tax=unclassified Streptomyces TaxID=2593676 RepID=UPI003662B227
MRSTSVRRTGLPVVAMTLLAGATACGLGSGGGTPSDGEDDPAPARSAGKQVGAMTALRSAERSTDGADSAKVESTTALGTLMTLEADGALGWEDGLTGTLTLTYTGGSVADSMRQMGATSMEARYLPDAYYAHMGDTFAAQSGGKHWIRYPYDALEKLGGGSGAYLKDQMQNTTPNQSVKLLLASGDVRRVGEETVRGERATHYAGTVEVADLAAHGSGLTASQLADLKRQLEQAGVTTERVDIWVNDRDLLVKKVEKGDTTNGPYSQTAYYSDYGVGVDVEEPPAGDTADFTELLQQQGADGTS